MPATSRILIITTGGTVTMVRTPKGLRPCQNAASLHEHVPELHQVATIDVMALANIDSSNLQPELWQALARTIADRIGDYDGVVVTHGTDTLSYTASALSFMLRDLPRPVVVTGAQIPLGEIGSDGRANLVNAVRVATSDLAEVVVVFGAQVIFGTRAKKTSVFDMQAITSVNELPLGNIGLFTRFNLPYRRRGDRRCTCREALNEHLALIQLFPGFNPALFDYVAKTHDGIVVAGYGTGNLPSEGRSLLPGIRTATARGVPVVVCTQCTMGSTQMELYQVGRAALEAGAIPGLDMTPETAVVKLMWVLGQTQDMRRVVELMQRPLAWELHPMP